MATNEILYEKKSLESYRNEICESIDQLINQVETVQQISKDEIRNLVLKVVEIDGCFSCVLRFFNVKDLDSKLLYHYLNTNEIEIDFLKVLLKKLEIDEKVEVNGKVCGICCGLLQPKNIKESWEKVEARLNTTDRYETKELNLNVLLNVGSILRNKLTAIAIRSRLNKEGKNYEFVLDINLFSIKKFWVLLLQVWLSNTTEYLISEAGKLSVVIEYLHPETELESQFLFPKEGKVCESGLIASIDLIEYQAKWHTDNGGRLRVAENLDRLYDSAVEVKSKFPILETPSTVHSITFSTPSVFIAGRYTKLQRFVSQTPWFVNGTKLAEDSVSDLLSKPIQDYFHPDSMNFVAAGREDADVRMLGTGRPYCFELSNPKRDTITEDELKKMTELINSKGNSKDLVQTSPLVQVQKEVLEKLKEGEQDKIKFYRCLVWFNHPIITNEFIDGFNNYLISQIQYPLQVIQRTPIRVLHRRAPLDRAKLIYKFQVEYVASNYLSLEVCTEAGTYIKELVHGDINRTTPNFLILTQEFLQTFSETDASLKDLHCDLMELDVLHINLEFP